MSDSDSESDGSTTVGAAGTYGGCRDVASLTPLHQILPYGSQLRDTASSAGYAWANQWWHMKGTCGDILVRHIEGTSGYRKIDNPRNWKF